ncbi:MAG TPA: hypothetical protein PL191_01065 [Candidatus Saccharimonas sp.]|nr:hypothetical protein [Candidatus Saccharimonas sp.]
MNSNLPTGLSPKPITQKKDSTLETVLIIIMCFVLSVGQLIVVLPVMVAGAYFVQMGSVCTSVGNNGPDITESNARTFESARLGNLQSHGEPRTEMVCNEAFQEYRRTVTYTAENVSVTDVEMAFSDKLNAKLVSNTEQFRQSDDGTQACRWQELVDAADKKVGYDVEYLYGGMQEDECVYNSNTVAEGDRTADYKNDSLRFTVTYIYQE